MQKKRWVTEKSKEINRARNSTQARQHKAYIWKKDNGFCRICGAKATTMHHPYGFTDYPALRTDMNNGYLVCDKCKLWADRKLEQRGGRPKKEENK